MGGRSDKVSTNATLVEKHFECPVILFDYPANIKAFYMRLNDDGKTVRAMDILFPGIGEIVGGAQREERLEVLKEKMAALGYFRRGAPLVSRYA